MRGRPRGRPPSAVGLPGPQAPCGRAWAPGGRRAPGPAPALSWRPLAGRAPPASGATDKPARRAPVDRPSPQATLFRGATAGDALRSRRRRRCVPAGSPPPTPVGGGGAGEDLRPRRCRRRPPAASEATLLDRIAASHGPQPPRCRGTGRRRVAEGDDPPALPTGETGPGRPAALSSVTRRAVLASVAPAPPADRLPAGRGRGAGLPRRRPGASPARGPSPPAGRLWAWEAPGRPGGGPAGGEGARGGAAGARGHVLAGALETSEGAA